jgi:V8-like Glu-specific endopeptidase
VTFVDSGFLGDGMIFPVSIASMHRHLGLTPSHAKKGIWAGLRQGRADPYPLSGFARHLVDSVRHLWRRSNPVRRTLRPCFDGLESRTVFSLIPVPPNAPSPFTAIVKIEGTFPDGESYVGSGFLVDSYHILTAGHLVYEYDDGGFATRITVIPELYGTSEPFGEATVTKERTTPAWQAFSAAHPDMTGPDAQDIGLITLNRQIGNGTGWMSFGHSNDVSIYNPGAIFDTAGYPADPASGYDGLHMAYSSGPILGLSPGGGAIGYDQSDVTTYGGQSGSPLCPP